MQKRSILNNGYLGALIFVNSAVPIVMLLADGALGRLGVNPIEFFLRATGVLTLIFLLLTLSVTPLRRMTGWNELGRHRRMLGLFSFFYGFVHLVTYSVFDKSLDASAIAGDVVQRPFIAVGATAFLLLVPLAITSTKAWVKRLGGKNWSRLHRLTYVIAVLGVTHFWMIVKSDIFYPMVFGFLLAILLGYRIASRTVFRQARGRTTQGLREE